MRLVNQTFISELQLSFQILEGCLQNPCQVFLNLTVSALVVWNPLTVLKAPQLQPPSWVWSGAPSWCPCSLLEAELLLWKLRY